MDNISAWQQARHHDVTSRFGDLALEALIELSGEGTIKDIPGSWKPNAKQGSGLIATFLQEEQVVNAQGSLISGEISLEVDRDYVSFAGTKYAMATAQPGSPFLLAVYNEAHEALTKFSHIKCYDYNENHIYIGKYVQAKDQSFTFQHTGDVKLGSHQAGRQHQSKAVIEVDIEGITYQLRPFVSGDLDIIVFRDATSNEETYAVGRMLVIENLNDNTVRLDFNKAFLPPCAFSPSFNCPMPPASNRIGCAIKAGEIDVVWK